MIHIYTDGSARGNPGPGGYGVIVKHNGYTEERSQGYRKTTNNRMELLAVIIGLEALKQPKQSVTIYSDSKYVINAIEKGWLQNWLKIDFKNKKNPDLWKRFWAVYQKHLVHFCWVKGHAGHYENERCDQLAVASSHQHLLMDTYYESLKSR
ncbi:MAG: ribonuclease HI [Candidatus Cardinium sp.]|uniref:ribonuclease HI n=1 Tax=Candidatus Cardinium sp. TP TaxID=2961955 RepID=UPI0021AF2F31|nr:ribonuclease HI [Candidatus Cardinium sp. TP]MCT4696943.1 ribonuclease HI [Candidatus Cardinium sp. TP]MDN5246886.1 ribonuclease HI [Candidatus Cardinium sp.]